MDKNQDPGSGDKYPGSAILLAYLDQENRTLFISCCINTFTLFFHGAKLKMKIRAYADLFLLKSMG